MTTAPTRHPHHGATLAPGALRVTGALTEPAQLLGTGGQQPHLLLQMRFGPAQGLHYLAMVDLGTDLTDHMAAEALMPHMRTGAVVTVAAEALTPRTEHGHTVLALQKPHSVVLLQDPTAAAHAATSNQPSLLEA